MDATTEQPAAIDAPDAAAVQHSIQTVHTAIGEFDKIAAGLAALEKAHPKDIACAVSTPAGMNQAIAGRAAWRTPRIAVEKARKNAKAPVLKLGRDIDAFARTLETKLLEGEANYDDQIKAAEAAAEAARQAKIDAERRRIAGLNLRIDEIKASAIRAVGKPAAEIVSRIQMLTGTDVGASFQELQPAAEQARDATLATLRELHAAAVAQEAEAARIAAERAELERRQAEQAEASRIERERIAEEERSAQARIEAQRIEHERAAAEKAERDRVEALRVAQHRAGIDVIQSFAAAAQNKTAERIRSDIGILQGLSFGDEWDEFAAEAAHARGTAVKALAELHTIAREREAEATRAEAQRIEQARVAAEQAEAQRWLDEQTAELKRQTEALDAVRVELRGTAPAPFDAFADSQVTAGSIQVEVIDLRPARPLPPPTLKVGEMSRRLGFTISREFLEKLGFAPVETKRAWGLWNESDWPLICKALAAHVLAIGIESFGKETP